jgi:hypothetical protein
MDTTRQSMQEHDNIAMLLIMMVMNKKLLIMLVMKKMLLIMTLFLKHLFLLHTN